MSSKKKFSKGSYAPRSGPGNGRSHPFPGGPARGGPSIGAARQKMGLPYEPAPPKGFRPGDQ